MNVKLENICFWPAYRYEFSRIYLIGPPISALPETNFTTF